MKTDNESNQNSPSQNLHQSSAPPLHSFVDIRYPVYRNTQWVEAHCPKLSGNVVQVNSFCNDFLPLKKAVTK